MVMLLLTLADARHVTGTKGSFGAAAAMSKLLSLSPLQFKWSENWEHCLRVLSYSHAMQSLHGIDFHCTHIFEYIGSQCGSSFAWYANGSSNGGRRKTTSYNMQPRDHILILSSYLNSPFSGGGHTNSGAR